MKLIPFELDSQDHQRTGVEIWNAACGLDLAINHRFMGFNTSPTTGLTRAGRLAIINGQHVGFVLVSFANEPFNQRTGFLEAIDVLPGYTRQGVGRNLLLWGEDWLKAHGCSSLQTGASPRPFAPGLPVETNSRDFFTAMGYTVPFPEPIIWDMSRSLVDYDQPYPLKKLPTELHPAAPEDRALLQNILESEFYGFWLFEFQEFLRLGGDISEYLLLWTPQGVAGFCQVAFECSVRPIERFYMNKLPHPWGQMGTFGVLKDQRGKGYGAILIDSAACYLRDQGIASCVIDWTGYLDLYARFGFKPFRQYELMTKNLT